MHHYPHKISVQEISRFRNRLDINDYSLGIAPLCRFSIMILLTIAPFRHARIADGGLFSNNFFYICIVSHIYCTESIFHIFLHLFNISNYFGIYDRIRPSQHVKTGIKIEDFCQRDITPT